MRAMLGVACVLALVLSVAGCGGNETDESASATAEDTPAVAEEAAPTSDEPTISELEFSIEGFNYEGITDEEGLKPSGGSVGTLRCEGQEIALASPEFERGFILTRDYGELKIRFAPTMTDMGFAIWTTPEQEQALAQLGG